MIDRARVSAALPNYVLGPELGAGAFGLVLAGQHRDLGRDVAVKVVARAASDEWEPTDFKAEARVLAGLDHPHIVRIYDYVERDDLYLIIMEMLPGGSLGQRRASMSPEGACAVGLAAAEALGYAHTRGVLHRDVKPANILFTTGGLLKVTDFGVAKIFDAAAATASKVIGTPRYMAPEQVQSGRLGLGTDLYAVGVVLYELFTGAALFDPNLPLLALFHHKVYMDPAPPEGVPEPVAKVIMRALAREQADRYPTARSFALDLAEAAARVYGPLWIDRCGLTLHLAQELRDAGSFPARRGRSAAPGPAHVDTSRRRLPPAVAPSADVYVLSDPPAAGQQPVQPPRLFPAPATPPPDSLLPGARPDPVVRSRSTPPTPAAPARPATSPAPPRAPAEPGRGTPPAQRAPTAPSLPPPAGPAGRAPAPPAAPRTPQTPPARPWLSGSPVERSGPSAPPAPPPTGPPPRSVPRTPAPEPAGPPFAWPAAWSQDAVDEENTLSPRQAPAAGRGRPHRGGRRRAVVAVGCAVILVLAGSLAVLLTRQGAPQPTTITTVAGTGRPAFSGDGGPATAAGLKEPDDPVFDGTGRLYFVDTGHNRIRRIDRDGTITTVAGTGDYGYSGDGGPATAARLASPTGLVLDLDGSLLIADKDNERVRRISRAGIISTVAGSGLGGFAGDGGPATAARLAEPTSLAVDGDGRIYVVDVLNHRVRRIDRDGTISTVAGNGVAGFSGDGGPATAAMLARPGGVVADGEGRIYIADNDNNRVRRVDGGGTITTIAGTGRAAFSGDGGPAVRAELSEPAAVELDAEGRLYVADIGNHRIRRIDPDGTISTVAGSGGAGSAGDGGPPTSATLLKPNGLELAPSGRLYVSDARANRIRLIAPVK